MEANPRKHQRTIVIDDVSKRRRSVTARINTAAVDRFGTVILPSGGDLRAFRGTPAVLWEHGDDPTRGRLPIGHCTELCYRRSSDDVLAVTQFKDDDYSDRIFQNYVDGTLTAFSVDFLPDGRTMGTPTRDEVKAHPEWAGAGCIFRKWELTGYSAVAYPGNPEALAEAVHRGLWVPQSVRWALPPPRGHIHVHTTEGRSTIPIPPLRIWDPQRFASSVGSLVRAALAEYDRRRGGR